MTPNKESYGISKVWLLLCLVAILILPITANLRAQNYQVIMTNNFTPGLPTGSANTATNFTNLTTGVGSWATASTNGANVLFNLTNNAVVTWGTTTSLQMQSLNETNGNTVTLMPSTNTGTFRITLGNATTSGGSITNQWATNANNSYDDVFLTNGSDMIVTNNGSTTAILQLYYSGSNNFDIGAGSTLTVDTSISGASAPVLNKTGAGLMIIAGADTSSASTYINGGTLQIGNGGTSGSINTKGFVDNASLVFDLANTVTEATNITGTGTVTQNGTGTLIMSAGNNSYTGGTVINSGTIKTGYVNALGSASTTLTFAGAGTLDLYGVGTLSFGGLNSAGSYGIISNSVGVATILNLTVVGTNSYSGVIKNGTAATALTFASGSTGSQTLTGASSYTGGTTIAAGNIYLGNANALGSSTGPLTLSGGTLDLGTLTVTSGATTLTKGSLQDGTLSSASGFTANNSSSMSVSANLAGAGGLTVSNTAGITLTGSNTYTGGTTITSGSSLTASSLGNGALSNSGTLIDASSSTMNVGALTLSNAYLYIQQTGGSITSSGGVTIAGASNTINLNTGWTNGVYNLISGTSITGSVINVTGNLLGGNSVSLGSSYTNGRTSFGLATAGANLQLTIGGGPANLNWTGALSTIWDTQTTANWYNTGGASNDVFYSGDNVTFSTNSPVSVTSGGVSAGSVTVTNASATTFTMGGGTVAATGLLVNGGGVFVASNSLNLPTATLVITNSSTADLFGTNTFSGVTVAGSSTLILDNFNAVAGTTINVNGGYITLNHNNNDTINAGTGGATITNSGSQTLTGVLAGSGGFTFVGSSTIVLAANSTQTGGITVQSGTLQVGTNGTVGALGGSSSPVTNNSSLVIDLTSNTIGNSISGSGSVTLNSGSGTITLGGTNTYSGGTLISTGSTVAIAGGGTNLPGNVTNNGSISLITPTSGGSAILGANISGTGSLNKQTNAGTVILTGSNTYTGGTTISGGVLQVGNGGTSGNLPSTGAVSIGAGSTLSYDISGMQTISNTVTGSGVLVQAGTGTLGIGFDNSANQLALAWTAPGTIYVTNNNAFPFNATISNSAVANGSSTATLSANVGNGNTLTISNTISEATGCNLAFVMPAGQTIIPDNAGIIGSKGFVSMSGQGTLMLNNANSADSWAGGTFINSGTLQIGSGVGNILGNGPITMNGGTFDLGGTTQGGAAVFTFNGGTVKDGILSLQKNSSYSGTGTITATMSGSSNCSVSPGATIVLGSDNTTNNGTGNNFTGAWNIGSNATILLDNGGGLGSSTVTVASGGRVDVNGNTYSTLAQNIFSNAVSTNAGVTNFLTVSNNSLLVAGSGPDGKGALYDSSVAGGGNVSGNLTLNGNSSIGATKALTISANITDLPNGTTSTTNSLIPGGYTLTVGSGSVTLSGSNKFASNAVASGATETIVGQSNLGATNGINLSGLLTVSGSISLANLNTTFNMTNSSVAGVDFGKMIVSGTLTYGGNMTIQSTQFSLSPFSVDLYDASTTGDFNSVTMDWGSNVVDLSETSGVWTGTDTNTGVVFTFTDATGVLTSAVPEPSACLLFGIGLSAVVMNIVRRRRNNS